MKTGKYYQEFLLSQIQMNHMPKMYFLIPDHTDITCGNHEWQNSFADLYAVFQRIYYHMYTSKSKYMFDIYYVRYYVNNKYLFIYQMIIV